MRRNFIVAQFAKPSGLLGRLAGLIMTVRPSNRERTLATLDRLGIQAEDRVLELGFGPGLGIAPAAELARPQFPAPFDKAFAINVFMFWDDPIATLGGLRDVMRTGGTVALTVQPRHPGATDMDARAVGDRMEKAMREAGFDDVRSALLPLQPVAAACVLACA